MLGCDRPDLADMRFEPRIRFHRAGPTLRVLGRPQRLRLLIRFGEREHFDLLALVSDVSHGIQARYCPCRVVGFRVMMP
jgi:hypothetical protein